MKAVSVVHRVGVVALAVFLSWSTAFGQTVLTCGSIVNGSVGGDGQVVYFFDAEAGDDVIIYLLCTDTGTYGAGGRSGRRRRNSLIWAVWR